MLCITASIIYLLEKAMIDLERLDLTKDIISFNT